MAAEKFLNLFFFFYVFSCFFAILVLFRLWYHVYFCFVFSLGINDCFVAVLVLYISVSAK